MKSKEEIFAPKSSKIHGERVLNERMAFEALDEYAEQIAIEFASYITQNWLFEDAISGKPMWYQSENKDFKPLTGKQLFQKFKKENNIQ